MSGYEVCCRVRQDDSVNDPWDPHLPIIMLSAKAEHTDRVRGWNPGAADYVTMPSSALAAPTRSRGIIGRDGSRRSVCMGRDGRA